jgi:hypothetical protein
MSRLGRLAAAALLCGAVLGVPLPAAHAAAYRYWTYWHAAPGSATWTFAGTGPTYRPSDRSVEGWRFAVSGGTASAPPPRTDPATAYGSACTGVTAASGEKVVALVLDYGTASDAPPGEKPPGGVAAKCVHVAAHASGFDVLRAAGVTVRQQDGLTCGLNGYPRTECAPVVTRSPAPSPRPTPTRSASPTPSPSNAHATTSSTSRTPSSSATHPTLAPASSRPTTSTPTSRVVAAVGTASAAARPSAAEPDATPSLVVGDVSSGNASGPGGPWPFVGGSALLLVLAGGAGLRARRRR